jgi:hypothetical protein
MIVQIQAGRYPSPTLSFRFNLARYHGLLIPAARWRPDGEFVCSAYPISGVEPSQTAAQA